MNNTSGFYNGDNNIKVSETSDENINMSITFVKHNDRRNQRLLIDSPDELFYNPSTKTLHADNFSGAHSNLIEGEAIKLTHDTTNHTTMIDVNFDKNTAVTTSISALDTILVQDSLDFLKTISGANLRESLKPTAGSNLSYDSLSQYTLSVDADLTGITKVEATSNDLEIKTTTDNEIQFKTNNIERLSIDSTKLDSSVNINIPLDKHYQINGVDVLHNTGSSTNIILNAKFIQNTVSPYDGLYINYLAGSTVTTSHCRLYAGTTTPRMMIKADTGKIGIATESPSEILDVVGNIKCSGVYKGDGSELTGITDTQYLLGNNLSFNTSTTPHTINLSTTLTNMVKIVGATNLTLQTENEQIFLTGFDGVSGGDDIIWKTNRGSGVVEMMKLEGTTNILTLQGIMDITGDYKKNGNIIPETILANNGLNLSGAGVLKIDIASCVGKSTITSTDLFILQIADGTSKKMTGAELLVATAGTDTTYTNGTNITIDSNNAINLNSNITGNMTFDNNVTISGSIYGEIHPYVTTSQVDYDQPIVTYQASGVVPLLPNQQSLIVPKTNIITVNSSTGLLKSKSIEVTGSLSATTNITATTSMTTGILYTTTINSTTTNSTTINAGGNIDCMSLTGGTNNSASNFHIDNINTSGELFLNYSHNNNMRMGNVPATSLSDGGRFTIFSNQSMPLRLHNSCGSTFTTGWTASLQQDSIFDGATIIHGFYKNLSTTKYTHTIGLSSNTSGGDSPLWLNCYHADTVDWTTSNYKFCPVGGDTITRRIFSGVRPGMGLTAGLSNSAKINCGRSTSYDIGVRLSGWNGGAVEASHHIIQASTNLHIDASTAGDIYLNYYGQNTNSRKCRVYGFVNGSDRRIKNNFIPIDDDKLLNQIEQLELTTYNFKDPRFKSNKNTLGFIADSLENQSYFENFMEISNYNIPFDEIDQIELEYNLTNKIITVSNYTLDLNKEYYYYAYKEDGNFLTIENKPLTENTFECYLEEKFIKLVVIGTKEDDMKNIKTNKLVAPCYAGVQALIKKNKYLENEVIELKNTVNELENKVDILELQMKIIYDKLSISYI